MESFCYQYLSRRVEQVYSDVTLLLSLHNPLIEDQKKNLLI